MRPAGPGPHPDANARSSLSSAKPRRSSTGCPASITSRPMPTIAPVSARCSAHARRRTRLRADAAEPARPRLVDRDRARRMPSLGPLQASMMETSSATAHLAASSAYATLPRAAITRPSRQRNVRRQRARRVATSTSPASTPALHIAVAPNDWCIDLDTGRLDEERAAAFVAAYESVRPLESAEVRLMPALMSAAAFRFWLSRVWDAHLRATR